MQPQSHVTIVRINGRDFVSDLMWRPLSKPRAYMAEARQIGKLEGMDIVAIRSGATIIQAGFVRKSDGVTRGMYSLACALAGQFQERAWIGAFELPTGEYALVAVFDGLVIPGCDIIGERQEIRNRLIEIDSQEGVKFERVYHPDDFEYRGEQLNIEELLIPSKLSKDYALKQLTFGLTKKELLLAGSAASLLVFGAIGYFQWVNYQEQQAREEAIRQEERRQQELAELQARAGGLDLQASALTHPWADMPGIADFLNGCQGAINSMPLSLGGWPVSSAICTGTTLEVAFERVPGGTTFSQFIEAAAKRFPAPPVLLEGGERAVVGDEITLGAGGDDELLPVDEMRSAFTSHMQRMELKVEIVEAPATPSAPPTQALPGQEPPAAPPAPDWKKFTFTLTTEQAPETVFSELSLPGIRLTEISVNRSDITLSWTIKGDIYAR